MIGMWLLEYCPRNFWRTRKTFLTAKLETSGGPVGGFFSATLEFFVNREAALMSKSNILEHMEVVFSETSSPIL
jgi:hypothetical protein